LIDELAVDISSIRRTKIDDAIDFVIEPELSMAAGNLGVVEPDRVRVFPTEGHGT
jgi:hypothetical protein